mgnify:CR=1 FL=1
MDQKKQLAALMVLVMLVVPMTCCADALNVSLGSPATSVDENSNIIPYSNSGSSYRNTFEFDKKTEIDRLSSKDGIVFTLLDDGTARIESFPMNWNGMNSESEEWVVPSEVVTEDGKLYSVSEIANGAYPTYKSPYAYIQTPLKITTIKKIVLPSNLIKICDTVNPSVNNYSLMPTNTGTFSFVLDELIIPQDSKLEYIGAGAFFSVKLDNISIPATVKYIGDCAFYSVSNISIASDSVLEYVGDAAFRSLKSDCNLVLPSSLKHVGSSNPFGDASVTLSDQLIMDDNGLLYSDSSKNEIISFIGNGKSEVTVPEGVIRISDEAFFGSNIETITLPNSLQTIGKYAFAECGSLKKIVFNPDESELTTIDDYAFSKYIESKDTVSQISQFGNNSGMMIFPEGLLRVGKCAFYTTTNHYNPSAGTYNDLVRQRCSITSIVIGGSLQEIGSYSFAGLYTLNNLTFRDSVDVSGVSIGDHAFYTHISSGIDSNQRSISFNPDRFIIKTIGDYAFSDNNTSKILLNQFGDSPGKVIIPKTVESLGVKIFDGSVNGINELVFQNNGILSIIPESSFAGFSNITSLDLSPLSSLLIIGKEAFSSQTDNKKLETFKLPQNTEGIGASAFKGQKYIGGEKSIVLPSSIKDIGSNAFSGIPIDSFVFPNHIMDISYQIFNTEGYNPADSHVAIVKDKSITITGSTDTVFPKGQLKAIIADDGSSSNNLFKIVSSKNKDDNFTGLIYNHELILVVNYFSDYSTIVLDPNDNTFSKIRPGLLASGSNVDSVVVKGDVSWDIGSTHKHLKTIITQSGKIQGDFQKNGTSIIYMSEEAYEQSSARATTSGWISGILSSSDKSIRSNILIIDKQKKDKPVVIIGDVKTSDGELILSFIVKQAGGYTCHDLNVKAGSSTERTLLEYEKDSFSLNLAGNNPKYITIEEKDRKSTDLQKVNIMFDSNGGSFLDGSDKAKVSIPKGMTLIDEDCQNVPIKDVSVIEGWYADSDCTTPFDFDAPVDEDITLYPKWVTVPPRILFTGSISVVSEDGTQVESGARASGDLTISFVNYSDSTDFKEWAITSFDGSVKKYYQPTITLAPTSDITISVSVYTHSGASLDSIVDTDVPISDIVRSWSVGGYIDTSMAQWTGMPSTPISVDDRIYVRFDSRLYMLESDTGYILKSVESKTATEFYHYVGYGDKQILDFLTSRVYDLDLNYLYTMPVNLTSAVYHDGYFYGPGTDGMVYRFVSDPSIPGNRTVDGSWSSPYPWYGMYGQCSAPVFENDRIYYISVGDALRYIVSVSLIDGSVDRIELGGIRYHMLDDGWLTSYEGRLYLTSYSVGLFGTVALNDWAKITSVSIAGGIFSDIRYMDVNAVKSGNSNPIMMNSMLSKLVVVDGIGFINASCFGSSNYLIAYDMVDMSVKAVAESYSSHGSIVATKKNDGTYIYLLPYASGSDLTIFKYDNNATLNKLSGIYSSKDWNDTYNSQGVRSDSDGRLYWYNDGGRVSTYTVAEKNPYFFFISDGRDAVWVEASGSDVLSAAGSTGLISVSGNTIAGARLSLEHDYLSGWSVFSIKDSEEIKKGYILGNSYGWNPVLSNSFTNYDDLNSHYIAIVNDKSNLDGKIAWGYDLSDKTRVYHLEGNIGDRDIVGKMMWNTSPNYQVTSGNIFNCDVILPTGNVSAGASIVVKVIPKEGFDVKTVSYTDSTGKLVYANHIESTTYSFDMPNHNVAINAICGKDVNYELSGTVSKDSSKLTLSLTVGGKTGTSSLSSPYLLVISEYDLGNGVSAYTNMYQKAIMSEDVANEYLAVSSTGLTRVTVHLIEDLTSAMIVDYSNILVYEIS